MSENNLIVTSNLKEEFKRAKNNTLSADPVKNFQRKTPVAKTVTSSNAAFNGQFGGNAAGNVNFYSDFPSDPFNETSILYMPQNRLILNAWLRYWDMSHPLIGPILDLHSTYPFSRFEYGDVDDESVLDIYRTADEKVHLFRRILEMAREYWLMGEFLVFKSWDPKLGIWDKMHLLNPDDVEIEGDIVIDPEDLDYYWIPPQSLRDILLTYSEYASKLREKLDPVILAAIETGQPVPLDKFSISHIARRGNPFETRGQSICTRCISTLQYEEQLISAQRAIAQRHIFPLQIFKIGDSANNFIPSTEDLEAFRDVLMSVSHDPNKAIIYHDALDVDFQGTAGNLLDLNPEFEKNTERILTALFTNKQFIQGEGASWSNATVAARMLSSRYITMRHLMEDFIKNDFCKPIAVAHGLYKSDKKEINGGYRVSSRFGTKEVSLQALMKDNEAFFTRDGKLEGSSVKYKGLWYRVAERDKDRCVIAVDDEVKKLNIPSVKWMSKINLVDDMENKQIIIDLFREGNLPFKMVADVMDLDYKVVEKELLAERNTIFDPYAKEVMNSMVQDSEQAANLLDQYAAKILKKTAERGIDVDKDIFPKLQLPEQEGDDFKFGSVNKNEFSTPLSNLDPRAKIKKLQALSRMAGFDKDIQKALKTYTSKYAKQVRTSMMKDKTSFSSSSTRGKTSDDEEKEDNQL